jgi:hypothetical protein
MKKKVRKPRNILLHAGTLQFDVDHNSFTERYPCATWYTMDCTNVGDLIPKDCRKLAAWLIKAADYLEAKGGK